jgi:FKBP-type peptidyl-prolyl cis-trans isomerase FkpA
MKSPLVLVLIFTFFISCSSDKENTNVDYTAQNEADITAYIAQNNLTATRSDTGLYYVINEPGTGNQPSTSSTVTVSYKGYYLNGSVFDESEAAGISFSLQNVIKGWTEGITYFKEGGNGMLLIPSNLAYGSNSYRGIPGGSVLIFDIKLISIN